MIISENGEIILVDDRFLNEDDVFWSRILKMYRLMEIIFLIVFINFDVFGWNRLKFLLSF